MSLKYTILFLTYYLHDIYIYNILSCVWFIVEYLLCIAFIHLFYMIDYILLLCIRYIIHFDTFLLTSMKVRHFDEPTIISQLHFGHLKKEQAFFHAQKIRPFTPHTPWHWALQWPSFLRLSIRWCWRVWHLGLLDLIVFLFGLKGRGSGETERQLVCRNGKFQKKKKNWGISHFPKGNQTKRGGQNDWLQKIAWPSGIDSLIGQKRPLRSPLWRKKRLLWSFDPQNCKT